MDETNVKEYLEAAVLDVSSNFVNQRTGSDERQAEAANLQKIVDAYAKVCQVEVESNDRAERRRIEEKKIDSDIEELRTKEETPFWQYCVEWSIKYIAPGALSALCFNIFQKRVLKFEETGTLRTKASKDLRNSWAFWK